MKPYPSQCQSSHYTRDHTDIFRFDLMEIQASLSTEMADSKARTEQDARQDILWRAIDSLTLENKSITVDMELARLSFQQLLSGQQLIGGELWYAQTQNTHDETSDAACLYLLMPGHTASVITSPGKRNSLSQNLLITLLEESHQYADFSQINMFQALTDPNDDTFKNTLKTSGYRDLACMNFLMGSSKRIESSPAYRRMKDRLIPIIHEPATHHTKADHSCYLLPYTEALKSNFIQTIEASYQDTMDCPDLVGKREMTDVWAAHKNTGLFTPQAWFLLMHDGSPAGIFLFNAIPPANPEIENSFLSQDIEGENSHPDPSDGMPDYSNGMAELVYMGIVPEKRGLGLGQAGLISGVQKIFALGFKLLSIAVDESNAPALKVYNDMNLTTMLRKHVMIKTG